MTTNEAVEYIYKNARFSPDAPKSARYYVRFPHPNAAKVFFSDDTADLRDKVYKYANLTKDGRAAWRAQKAKATK